MTLYLVGWGGRWERIGLGAVCCQGTHSLSEKRVARETEDPLGQSWHAWWPPPSYEDIVHVDTMDNAVVFLLFPTLTVSFLGDPRQWTRTSEPVSSSYYCSRPRKCGYLGKCILDQWIVIHVCYSNKQLHAPRPLTSVVGCMPQQALLQSDNGAQLFFVTWDRLCCVAAKVVLLIMSLQQDKNIVEKQCIELWRKQFTNSYLIRSTNKECNWTNQQPFCAVFSM